MNSEAQVYGPEPAHLRPVSSPTSTPYSFIPFCT